ncbi:hypothetical protein AT1219_150022 [Vibrio alginolyticus]
MWKHNEHTYIWICVYVYLIKIYRQEETVHRHKSFTSNEQLDCKERDSKR